ncbi:MAG: SemiSWEET transporter [Parcubacteria group bacterium]|nr:SemiSWEET transporter [Parcubacteria group bacterium]
MQFDTIKLLIGISAGILCTISFVPQVFKIYKTKQTKDLSLITFTLFFLGVLLWLIYGVLINELPIILANTATLIIIFIILVMKVRYK